MTTRLQTTDDLTIGTEIFYTGDAANIPWTGTIIGIDGACNAFQIEHKNANSDYEDAPNIVTTVMPLQIGTEYQGHCDPRFVTVAAVRVWREKMAAAFA